MKSFLNEVLNEVLFSFYLTAKFKTHPNTGQVAVDMK